MLLFAAVLIMQDAQGAVPSPSDPHQAMMDADAARMAGSVKGDLAKERGGEPLVSRVASPDPMRHPWRTVTDADMRSRSGYWAPADYRYHRVAKADMDHDGRQDLVEMVENGQQQALRITYAAKGKPSRIVARAAGIWADEALLPAGPNAVMINYPESRVYFAYQRGDRMWAKFIGD